MSAILRVAYDGAGFHGYARQPGGVRTVQGELERALATLYSGPVALRTASRTDAGVHATGQLVAFDPPRAIPERGLLLGLGGLLPADLAVVAAWSETRPGGAPVEPRFENRGKRYRYRIRCGRGRDPWEDRRAWHLPRPLDVEAMAGAAARFVGVHDFAGFRAASCQARTTRRRIRRCDVSEETYSPPWPRDPGGLGEPGDTIISVEIVGDAFLHTMVRVMVGTLVEVGRGRRAPGSIDELLARPDRSRSGVTAPARGLTLVEVLWDAAPAPAAG